MDKRNKRFLSMALVLVLIIGLMPTNIASLGEDPAEQKLFYRWEINDAGDGLESISGGCYTGNALTVNTTKNTSADGTLNNFVALMANEVTLSHDEPWVVEWKAGGDWNGMLLSHLSGISQDNNDAGGHSIFRTSANSDPTTRQGIAIGAYKDADLNSTGYAHFGVDKPSVADYMDATVRTYRLENRVDEGVYFVVDGTTEIAMTTAFGVTTEATAEWLKAEDFAFNAIGTVSHPIKSMKLEYLEIMVNGECEHAFGDWTIANKVKERVCADCGYIDSREWIAYRWELNADRNALVSRDDGCYTDNDLSLQVHDDLNPQIVDGKITGYGAAMAEGVTLKHDEPWVIEWRSKGDWKGMLLADIATVTGGHSYYVTTGGNYIFRNGTASNLSTRPGITLGIYKDASANATNYGHFGVSKETTKDYMSELRTFRLENRLNPDGTNMVYLVIDGGTGIALTESNFGTSEVEPATWLSGRDYYFDGIGVAAQPLNNITLEYLQIFANGECTHTYGGWKTVNGKKLKECTMCGDTDKWEAYRWEIATEGETQSLKSITTGSYTENAVNKVSGSIADDTLTSYVGTMAAGITLEHDKAWVIEWEASGNWSGMLLCDIDNEGTVVTGGNYIFRNAASSSIGLGIGAYKDQTLVNGFGHFGVAKATIADYMGDAIHNYRLENRIVDGINTIWFVIDGHIEFEMTTALVSNMLADAATWLSGQDLYFNGFGKTGHTLNGMKLEYLEIFVDGECDHNYGDWMLVSGEKQRVCADCGRVDKLKAFRWEMNDAGDALESVTTGGYTQNNLTLNPESGTKITNTIADGKINKFSAKLDTGFLLKHDEAWVIQWQSKGDWDGMLFCDLGTNISNPEVGGNYLFRSSSNAGPAFGAYATVNTSFANFGIAAATSAQYMTASNTYTYRLENRIEPDGSNKVYLVVVEADAEHLLDQSLTKNVTVDVLEWFNGRDFYFDAIGTQEHALNNIYLNYLEVYVNGNGHVHSFGQWAVDVDNFVKRSCSCGKTEIAAVAIDDAGAFTGFATLEEALQAAASSQFDVYVMLFADQDTEDILDLPENVGIDLNGYTLTAAGLVSNGYGIIDRTGDKGALNVPKDTFAPSNTENADHLPIWNGENGYVFINKNDVYACRTAGAAPANGEATFFFRPEINATINAYLAAGAEVSGVELCVKISYTRDGEPKSVVGVYNDELIAKFYDGYDPQTDTYTKAFKLSLTGVEGVTDLSYEIYYEAQGVHVTIAEYTPAVSAGE